MAVAAIGAVLLAPLIRAQQPDVDHWAALEAWVAAIERHEAGRSDPSLRAIASLPARDFEDALPFMVFLLERAHPDAGTRPFDDLFRRLHRDIELTSAEDARLDVLVAGISRQDMRPFFRRAGIFHTDLALMYPDAHLTTSEGASHIAADGRARGDSGRPWHWMVARSFLHLALTDWSDRRRPRLVPDSDPDVRLWYQATANHLWSVRNYTEGTPHVQRGLELFPEDAELHFVRGLIHEGQSSPHIQAAVAEQARTVLRMPGKVYRPAVKRAENERDMARDAFRRALALDPGHLEARLHLADVLNAGQQYGEAAQELSLVLAGARAPWHRYFGFLFLGRAEEGRQRLAEARAAYKEASALYPEAQAPRLALSQLDMRAGDRDAALLVSEFLSRERRADADPWWMYDAVREPEAEVVWLQRMHAAFLGPAR